MPLRPEAEVADESAGGTADCACGCRSAAGRSRMRVAFIGAGALVSWLLCAGYAVARLMPWGAVVGGRKGIRFLAARFAVVAIMPSLLPVRSGCD